MYLVAPGVRSALTGESTFGVRLLVTCITRRGQLFLWPLKLPRTDGAGGGDSWNRSALEAASRGQKRWVRVSANMSLQRYDIVEAPGDLEEPEWPDMTFQEILEIAFRDRLIDSLDHPVLRRLRGEI